MFHLNKICNYATPKSIKIRLLEWLEGEVGGDE
jgi:hypothetical protein